MHTSFHRSDIAFVTLWSVAAPGLDGWRLAASADDTQVRIIPPGAQVAAFVITLRRHDVAMARLVPDGGRPEEVRRFPNIRAAVLALCPLDGEALEEINLQMEREFPRDYRRDPPHEVMAKPAHARFP